MKSSVTRNMKIIVSEAHEFTRAEEQEIIGCEEHENYRDWGT